MLDVVDIPMPEMHFDSQTYVVQPGDTLASIASRYQLDPNRLASINAISKDKLRPRQILRLERSAAAAADRPQQVSLTDGALPKSGTASFEIDELLSEGDVSELQAPITSTVDAQGRTVEQLPAPTPIVDRVAQAVPARPEGVETIIADVRVGEPSPDVRISDTQQSPANNPAAQKVVKASPKGWNWPAVGEVVKEFDLGEVNRQGVDINAQPGAGVLAAADGEVVYSGKDLASYGNLVILRHDDNYLSAYSKVHDIIVKENQKVRAGETIAMLSSDSADAAELHFEIRHNGEPVNPIEYLPTL